MEIEEFIAGKQYLDYILHTLRFSNVHPVDTLLSSNATGYAITFIQTHHWLPHASFISMDRH